MSDRNLRKMPIEDDCYEVVDGDAALLATTSAGGHAILNAF